MRVLVVDDSPSIRERLVTMMREVPGVEPTEASDADEAVRHVRERGADVVVLDVHMPGKSGLAIVAALKASPSHPVVVVVTSDPTEQHRARAMARGADYFFDKTREFGRVVDVLSRTTRRRTDSDA